MKKKSLLLLPTIVGLFLCGCNSSGNSGENPTTGGQPTSATPTSAPAPSSSSTPAITSASSVIPPAPSSSSVVPPQPSSSSQSTSTTPTPSSSSDPGPVIVKYLITFKDEAGNTLDSKEWAQGSIPSYIYNKADTAEWDYTVEGWSLTQGGAVITLPAVTAEATYFAVVSQVKKQYTITFDSRSGSAVDSITEDYGTNVSKPTDPKRDGYNFVAWSTDPDGVNKVTWPYNLVSNVTFYANWNEKVDIKGYFQTLMQIVNHDPYSYIPSKMKKDNSGIRVTSEEVNYNFNNSTSVSNIKYGGFGEQWHMVIENIEQSELFYSVLAIGETAMNASVVLFNNYLDNNPGDTASHTLDETTYTASIDFHTGILTYSIRYKTNLDIPFFGNVTPQVDMTYNVTSLEKTVRIQLTENNAMKYSVTDDQYIFGLQYGVETVSRKAYFSLNRNDDESVEGHIYEFVQYKDKDLVPACADFYINEDYTTVVGNKASGLVGFTNYICEVYQTNVGKLLGYEIQETLSSIEYNTLWFNLNNITGINSYQVIEDKVHVNGSANVFATKKYGGISGKTLSRRFDIEQRLQYFYGTSEDDLVEYKTSIPMMFVQEEKLSDFVSDIVSVNSYLSNVGITLSSTYLEKIQADYDNLVPVFAEHREDVTGSDIETFIGSAAIIS